MHKLTIFAVALALTIPSAAFAQTFLVPDTDCGSVTFHLTSSTGFPALGETIAADRTSFASLWTLPQPRDRQKIELTAGPRSLTFPASIAEKDEVVMAAVELRPQIVGNETRTDHAKALVFCGAKTPKFDWQRSIGLGVELYPQGWNGPRPDVKTGDPMRFIAVAEGKIIGELPMDLYGAGGRLIGHGANGEAVGKYFRYPEPGQYMVVATWRRPDPGQPDHWLVDTSTLTFDVK
jgi:hypothetical protein